MIQFLQRIGASGFRKFFTEMPMGAKVHGDDANAPRPAGYKVVTWVGSVEPVNMEPNDIWAEDVTTV